DTRFNQALEGVQAPPAPAAGEKLKARVNEPFDYEMVHPNDLTDVARITRRERSAAFVSRFVGRVWDDTAVDASFF
ncbi:unnamed protein product, partial [Sphacelaria rigidula]